MKAYMLMTKSGPIVVLTSHTSILDTFLLEKLADKGIEKFIAYEIPIGLVEQQYGAHFTVVRGDLRQTDDLRVLDEDGERPTAPRGADRVAAARPRPAVSGVPTGGQRDYAQEGRYRLGARDIASRAGW
jgi:hypothetical protein